MQPCAEVQIINEDEPLRTPRAAFARLASVPNPSHNQRLLASSFPTEASPEKRPCDDEENEWEDRVSGASMMTCQLQSSSSSDDDLECEMKDRSNKHEGSPECRVTKERFRAVTRRKGSYQAPLTFWPHWVYQMYDSFALARRAAGD